MDNSQARLIIEALADGIDPVTGEVFPRDSALQNPDVIRALFLASKALEQAGTKTAAKKPRDPSLPTNAGRSWDIAEDHRLVASFEAGSTEKELAVTHERTITAIRSRLIKLGKLEPNAGENHS